MNLYSLIEKKIFQLEELNQQTKLNAYFIGNDLQSNLFSNFDFSKYFENFFDSRLSSQASTPDMLVIWGGINTNQIRKVKKILEDKRKDIKKVVYVKSTASEDLSKLSCHLVENLEDHIHIDIIYEKFPVVLADFFSVIKNERFSKYEN